ncbi:MAG: NAD(+)/NADH kinase [Chthoniobacterales bacterium]
MRAKTVGLIAHTAKAGSPDLVRQVSAEFERHGVRVLVEQKTAALVAQQSDFTIANLAAETDLLVVIGGDGTILNVVGQLDDIMPPIFGINIGALGFLTCANSSACVEAVESIVRGEIAFSKRALLEISITGVSKAVTALNDAVFSRGEISRLIRLKTKVNNESLTEYNADGLIIATPTGSTAYSLSAGGPILAPDSGSFVITPICPHVLTNRSIIVDESATIEVEVSERDYPVFLTIDGRDPVPVSHASIVSIKKSARVLPLAALPGASFFNVVRQKLKWSGSNF